MKRLLFLLALLIGAPPAGAQVADTVLVTIEGDLAVARIQVPDTTIAIGDTIFFTAIAEDSEGDPVTALFTWSSSDPAVLEIDANTGVAVGLSKTSSPVEVYLMAQKVTELRMASFRDGELNWSGNDSIPLGGFLQYCGYILNEETVVAQNPLPPQCPNLGPPVVPFAAYALFPGYRYTPYRYGPRSVPLWGDPKVRSGEGEG